MPNKDIVNKAADKAYEAHANDETGLALSPKKKTSSEDSEDKENKPENLDGDKAKDVLGIVGTAAGSLQSEAPQQASASATPTAEEMIPPPVDLYRAFDI